MEVIPREVRVYRPFVGEAPFERWINGLKDRKAAQIIDTRIGRLRSGNLNDVKGVGAGVYELRIHFGPGYRLYFGQGENVLIILLWGGDKSTQKNDIEKAKEYWMDYLRGPHETVR